MALSWKTGVQNEKQWKALPNVPKTRYEVIYKRQTFGIDGTCMENCNDRHYQWQKTYRTKEVDSYSQSKTRKMYTSVQIRRDYR